jgi:hypothetical protein
MLRILRLVGGPALPVCFALIGMCMIGMTSASAEVSEEARQACTPDAMRLCSEFVPDVQRVTACMMRKRAQLSAACRVAMAREHTRYRHTGRVHCRNKYCR